MATIERVKIDVKALLSSENQKLLTQYEMMLRQQPAVRPAPAPPPAIAPAATPKTAAPAPTGYRARRQATAIEKPKGFQPSEQQLAFFKFLRDGKGNAVLEAVAGAGKTTTVIQGLAYLEGSIFLGAYNKAIAAELKHKVAELRFDRPGLFISTMHGACYSAMRSFAPKAQVDDAKTRKLLRDYISEAHAERSHLIKHLGVITRMVSFGKQFLLGIDGYPQDDHDKSWLDIAAHFSVDQDLPANVTMQQLLPIIMHLFRRSRDVYRQLIDFDDMIYLPIYMNARFFQNDVVILDEVQDINPARLEAATRMLKPRGRFIGVGDRAQAIYGFTGAGGDSIQKVIERFNAVVLPLTVSYRCPQAVVAYARQWVDHISAHPSAPAGEVRVLIPNPATDQGKAWFQREQPRPIDAVICRNTKPLIKAAYGMLRLGIGCKVEGRDIGKGLVNLASSWTIESLDRLEQRLDQWLANELAKANKDDSEKRAEDAQDRYDTLGIFITRCRDQGKTMITDLVAEIESMFADGVSGVVPLMTIHKSKGREFPRVYWLATPNTREPRKQWERVERDNVYYVGATRAKEALILVPDDEEK